MVAHSCLGWPLYRNSNEGAGPCLPSTRVLAPDCLCRALGQRFWPLSFTRVLGPRSSTRAPVLDRSSRALELHKGAGPRLSKQSSRVPQGWRPSIVQAELKSSTRVPALDCPSRALELHKGGGPCLPRPSSGAVQGCWPPTAEAGL